MKQQQVQRKAEEEIHRQRWTAYFEGQANAGTADMKGDMGQDELDDARHTDNGTDTVGVFGSIFYKVDDEKSL